MSPNDLSIPAQTNRLDTRRDDWIVNSLISGFAATFALTAAIFAAYGLAHALGDVNGNRFERWLAALHDNTLTRSTENSVFFAIALNLLVGIAWALIYSRFGAERLRGPSWWRGMVFSLVPWLLSIFVFFPIMDAGVLGSDLGAGPIPVIGNLILHLFYGATLGWIYAIDLEEWLDGSESDRDHNRGAERGAAIGLFAGAPIGLLVSYLLAPALDEIASSAVVCLLGAILGAGLGLTIGMFAGIERVGSRRSEHIA